MDYTGLVQRYRNNRPLSDDERAHRLLQGQRLDVPPHYELSVIQLNSCFLESVDRHYESRGALLLAATAIIAVCLWAYGTLLVSARGAVSSGVYTGGTAGIFLAVTGALFALVIVVSVWLARKEVGRLTHYPIRLDRRNRMIHLFKPAGGMLSVPWDEVFFTLGRCSGSGLRVNRDIRGLVLDRDGVTVRDQFAFSLWSPDETHLKGHWEFLRRYMEDGPAAVAGHVEFCLPIDGKRESFRVGLERVFANDSAWPLAYWLMWPLNFLTACARWIVMRSCRLPVWPDAIARTMPVARDDPYARHAGINPSGLR